MIAIPAFWLMFLGAILLEMPLAGLLGLLPVGVPLFFNEHATFIAMGAALVALFGNYCQLTEMLVNKNTSRDVCCMFGGATLLLMVFLTLPHWPLFVGRSFFALLTLFYPAACFGRAIMNRTDTVFSSLVLALISLVAIVGLTYFML